jgi:molecular chaperone DnaK
LGGVALLIERNTTIPTRKSQIFSTAGDNQTQGGDQVLQVERRWRRQQVVGQLFWTAFRITARCSANRIDLDIDANGIINVSAADKVRRSQKITLRLLQW